MAQGPAAVIAPGGWLSTGPRTDGQDLAGPGAVSPRWALRTASAKPIGGLTQRCPILVHLILVKSVGGL